MLSLVDILILVLLAAFLLKGVIRGLLKEVCSLFGLVLGGVFAFSFHLPLAQALQSALGLPAQPCVWAASLAIFVLVIVIFGVLGFVLQGFVRVVFLGSVNRLVGALFGLVQGVVVLSMLVLALNSSVAPPWARGMLHDSQLAPPFSVLGMSIYNGGREWLAR